MSDLIIRRRPLLIIFVILLVNVLGFGIIIPLLPFYASSLGASPFAIGLLFAAYSVSQLVAGPVLGELSDRHGRRPVLILSLIGTAVSFSLLAVAPSLSILFLARVLDGLSGGSVATARAYIADVTSEADRTRSYGLIGAAFGLGFILGPALGGALARFGYGTPAWAAAGLALTAALATWAWLPETSPAPSAVRRGIAGEFRRALAHPMLPWLLLVDGVYWAASSAYQTTFALFGAQRFSFDVTATGLTLTLASALAVAIQLGVVGRVAARIGDRALLWVGLALLGLGLGAMAVVQHVPLLLLALLPAAAGAAFAGPAVLALLSRAAAREDQGRMQGITGAVESLGRTVGPLWGNGMLGAFGGTAAYGSTALALLLIALVARRTLGGRDAAVPRS